MGNGVDMGKFCRDLIKQAQDAILRDDRHMAITCLDTAKERVTHLENTGNELIDERDEIIANLKSDVTTWQLRAISEARTRVRIAKEKNRLKEFNRSLLNKAYSFQMDDEGVRISYGALYADKDMICMELEERIAELNAAIHRLPEPPFGDGPDERVGWILELLASYRNRKPRYGKVVQDLTILEVENEELKRSVEQNLRAAQHAEAEVKRLRKDTIIWCEHSQVAWGEVTRLTKLSQETETFWDASFDIKQRLVVAEARLAALRMRNDKSGDVAG